MILLLMLTLQNGVKSKALERAFNIKKTFQLEFLPFKHFSFIIENLTPFGKFEIKHSVEKRDAAAEPVIANEIPMEEKKELIIAPPSTVSVHEHGAKAVPLIIEIAPPPKPLEAHVVHEKPIVANTVVENAPAVPVSNVPVFYTDISQIPLYSFAYSNPAPVAEDTMSPIPTIVVPEVPLKSVHVIPDVPVKPLPVLPEVQLKPVHMLPEVPFKPVPVLSEAVNKPVPVFSEILIKPVLVEQEIPVKPIVSEVVVNPIATLDDIPVQSGPLQEIPIKPIPIQVLPKPSHTSSQEVVVQSVPIVPEIPLLTSPPPLPVPPQVEAPVAPPPQIPNYLLKGSRLIVLFGTKILQMLSQFIESRPFSQFSLPPLPPLSKKK